MRLIIIGAGMYVTGRNGSGLGTILASVMETSKFQKIKEVLIVSRRAESQKDVKEAQDRLNKFIKSSCEINYLALGTDSLNNYKTLIKQRKFDACIISTPDHLHYEYARETMKRGIHCLVVKPLTPTLKESQDLVKLQKKYPVYCAVEFHKRWDETNLYIKRKIEEGAYGQPLYFVVDYSQKIDIPSNQFRGWVEQTNIFQYLGVHYVDLVYFLTGYKPLRVSAYGTNGILKSMDINTYDSVHAQIEWVDPNDDSKRLFSSHNTGWVDPNATTAMSDQRYYFVGSKGRINCNQKNRGLEEVTDAKGAASVNPYFSEFLLNANGGYTFQGYGHKSINQFLIDVDTLLKGNTSIKKLNKNRPTFKSSLVSAAVVDAGNKSLTKQSKWIKIPKI